MFSYQATKPRLSSYIVLQSLSGKDKLNEYDDEIEVEIKQESDEDLT